MRERSGRLLRVAVVWTILMLVIAVLLAAHAMSSLYDGQQACFFNTSVACPTNEDPAVTRLTFAFFGVPLIWLVGIGLTTLAWAWQRRRGSIAR